MRYGPIGNLPPGAPGELNGNYEPAEEADVRLGVQYGSLGTEFTGLLDVNVAADQPVITDVRSGVSYADGALVGVLALPAEPQVLLGVGYGAYGTEYVGLLDTSGGSGTLDPLAPVLSNGEICSPLYRGTAYTAAYGNAFVWRIKAVTGMTTNDTANFEGYSVCDGSLVWDVESTSITPVDVDGVTYWDFVFEMDSTDTLAVPAGEYDWRLTMTSAEEIVVRAGQFSVAWV